MEFYMIKKRFVYKIFGNYFFTYLHVYGIGILSSSSLTIKLGLHQYSNSCLGNTPYAALKGHLESVEWNTFIDHLASDKNP